MGLSFKSHFKHLIVKDAVGLSGMAFRLNILREVIGSNTVKLSSFVLLFMIF